MRRDEGAGGDEEEAGYERAFKYFPPPNQAWRETETETERQRDRERARERERERE